MKNSRKESNFDIEKELSTLTKKIKPKPKKKSGVFKQLFESSGKEVSSNYDSHKKRKSKNKKKKILSSKNVNKKFRSGKTKKITSIIKKSKKEINKKEILRKKETEKKSKKIISHLQKKKFHNNKLDSTYYSSIKYNKEDKKKNDEINSHKLIIKKDLNLDKRQYHSEQEKKKRKFNEYKLYKPKPRNKNLRNKKKLVKKKNKEKSIKKYVNTSVPINTKNDPYKEFGHKKLNNFNFNLSGYIETEKMINLITPLKSRKEIFKFQENFDNQKIVQYIKKFFKLNNLKDFKTKMDFYHIEKLIGKGTYGKVYESTHKLTGKKVAIKCIEKTTVKNFKKMQKIFNEIDILSGLTHRNIIKLFEIFENPKYYFFVTEFAQKGDLYKMLNKSTFFNESQIFLILKDILSALDYIHSKKILHRDIKLDNILITNEYQIKICDFGVSCKLDSYEMNCLKEKCGTPAYLAPEIILGNYSGFSSDVF